jgi:hypothetical protein
MNRALALLLCIAIAAPGCATARMSSSRFVQQTPTPVVDRDLLTAYIKGLPIGTKVRVSVAGGDTVRGTLMKASDESVTVLRRTRIPEPPVDIPVEKVRGIEPETSDSVARAVGIGVATGAAAGLGVFLLLLAIYAGD